MGLTRALVACGSSRAWPPGGATGFRSAKSAGRELWTQTPCRGRIQLLYIYFIACTVTLGENQKVDNTPAPPCDLAGLDLVFNLFLPRLSYRYGLCAALLAPVHHLPCERLPPGRSHRTRVCSPCSVAFVHNKAMEWRQPQAHVESGRGGAQMHIPASVDLFSSEPKWGSG